MWKGSLSITTRVNLNILYSTWCNCILPGPRDVAKNDFKIDVRAPFISGDGP